MADKISRRDFLKIAGAGAAVTTVLTGCGPASRYTTREPYFKMPEYNYNGQSTYYATTCRECAAACGLVVRTMQGRAIKVEGNQNNPVNLGKTCARGQATLHGLYNPDRVQNPGRHARGDAKFEDLDWDNALGVVAEALRGDPDGISFLLGLAPDHLFDLASEITKALGAPDPVRYGALSLFEARATLAEASRAVFGKPDLLYFDIAGADVIFSFGANFLETWLSPVAYTRGFSKMRRGTSRRGYLVQFEPRMSQTAMKADEWIPVAPGSEGLVAAALGRMIAEAKTGSAPAAFKDVDPAKAAESSGVALETLQRLATVMGAAQNPLAIPGGGALGQSNGLETAQAILALNTQVGNLGKSGGVYLTPPLPLGEDFQRGANIKEMANLVDRMNSGKVKTLFIHGVNPLFELPKSLGFAEALAKVPAVISFATFPDETALASDYVFPDHAGLESFGYQRIPTGSGQTMISGAQPAVAPFYNTRATTDVLLAAGAQAGGKASLGFKDEVEYIQHKLSPLLDAKDGYFAAGDMPEFWVKFQQFGGWWQNSSGLQTPAAAGVLDQALKVSPALAEGDGEFSLFTYVSPILAEAGANKPWLQEIPDPTTTVMWNTWLEINPATAAELGLANDDVVKVTSPFGEVELSVLLYPAIRPDVLAIPFGQGHSAYGRYAENRGVNPADLFGKAQNGAGDLAFGGIRVRFEKTGKTQPLSRLEGYTRLEQAEKKQ